ncbi:MAG: universal stress protein [Desulfatiglandales bacterium]
MVEIRRILFPVDFTVNSSKILPYVLSLSEKYEAVIYLLHVIEDFAEWGGFYIPHIPIKRFHEEALKGAQKTLDEICEEQLQNCPGFQKRIVFGDPAPEILKSIESEGVDLVIMGTHGSKGLDHVFFGSAAETVVKKSPVPVLTVNPYRL